MWVRLPPQAPFSVDELFSMKRSNTNTAAEVTQLGAWPQPAARDAVTMPSSLRLIRKGLDEGLPKTDLINVYGAASCPRHGLRTHKWGLDRGSSYPVIRTTPGMKRDMSVSRRAHSCGPYADERRHPIGSRGAPCAIAKQCQSGEGCSSPRCGQHSV